MALTETHASATVFNIYLSVTLGYFSLGEAMDLLVFPTNFFANQLSQFFPCQSFKP